MSGHRALGAPCGVLHYWLLGRHWRGFTPERDWLSVNNKPERCTTYVREGVASHQCQPRLTGSGDHISSFRRYHLSRSHLVFVLDAFIGDPYSVGNSYVFKAAKERVAVAG